MASSTLPIAPDALAATPLLGAESVSNKGAPPASKAGADPETLAEARLRAVELLRGADPQDADGLRALQDLTLSVGLPAAQALFRHIIAASSASPLQKKCADRAVTEASPVTAIGCWKVDFHDRTTGLGNVAYLRLASCPKDHDLTAQLEKLKTRCAENGWPAVLRSLSSLIQIGRTVYAQLAQALLPQLAVLAPARQSEFLSTKVDHRNTTLYLDAAWPDRIGIFVTLEAELGGS